MKLAKFFLYALVISISLGELGRISMLGQSFLITDILAFATVFFALAGSYKKETPIKLSLTSLLAILFLNIAFISLIINFPDLPQNEFLKGFLYLGRYSIYISLLFLVPKIIKTPENRREFFGVILFTGVLTAILGFLQLKYFGDFEELKLYEKGYDPHIGRLTSTWLDPNFVGGLFAFISALALARLWENKEKRVLISLCLLTLIVALYFTYSRSAYLFFAAAVFTFGLIRARLLLLVGFLCLLPLLSLGGRFTERVTDMANSAISLLGQDDHKILDDTSRLRVKSWQEGYEIFEENPALGSGYGTYGYANRLNGNLKDEDAHSASGADSSLLTILATTGLLGFIAFLLFNISLVADLISNYLKSTHSRAMRVFALGSISGCAGFFVHSFFVNSYFLPLMLAVIIPCISLGITFLYEDKK